MVAPTPELPDDAPIERVLFSTRIQNALIAADLKTVGEVREVSDETLIGLPDFGKGSLSDLRKNLGLPSTDGVRAIESGLNVKEGRLFCDGPGFGRTWLGGSVPTFRKWNKRPCQAVVVRGFQPMVGLGQILRSKLDGRSHGIQQPAKLSLAHGALQVRACRDFDYNDFVCASAVHPQ